MIDVDVKIKEDRVYDEGNHVGWKLIPVVKVTDAYYRADEDPVVRHVLDLLERDIRNAIVSRVVEANLAASYDAREVIVRFEPEKVDDELAD